MWYEEGLPQLRTTKKCSRNAPQGCADFCLPESQQVNARAVSLQSGDALDLYSAQESSAVKSATAKKAIQGLPVLHESRNPGAVLA